MSETTTTEKPAETCRPGCPVCGGTLEHVKQKTICTRCRSIVETCCEGGRG